MPFLKVLYLKKFCFPYQTFVIKFYFSNLWSGFSGIDCSERTCPVLCNGNGYFENGKCSCNFDYHGDDCGLLLDQCEFPGCTKNNGECVQGKCICVQGFMGKFCEQIACPGNANCSGNGVCSLEEGICKCFNGFSGIACNQVRLGALLLL